MAKEPTSAERYCFELVREADKDRFLSALFVPDDRRRAVMALYAFNVEIARIRDMITDPTLGEIRLQWWMDAIEAAFAGEMPEHPVLEELKPLIDERVIHLAGLANLIEARRFDLYDDPMPSLNDLEGYLGETSSALIQMVTLAIAGRQGESAAEASGLAGVAFGIAGLLRSVPLHRARGQCYLPGDVLERHGIGTAHVLSGRWDGKMSEVFRELSDHARQRLEEARGRIGSIPAAALPAFLPATLVPVALDAVGKVANPLKDAAMPGQLRRQWLLWRAARRGRF
jgi:phytoene synthase